MQMMDTNSPVMRLAIALSIGLVIGLERGWRSRNDDDHQRAAGLRTFAVSGLLGGVAAMLGQQLGGAILGLAFVGYTAAFAAFHWLEARAENNLSVTSVVAGMATFMLGALAVVGDLNAAIAGAVGMTVLLALRDQLHRWIATLTWPEIRAGLTLLAMTFLLLPVLPNRTIDPWNAINPHQIWLLTVLIATVSFSGYVAIRLFDDRLGIIVASVAGGLASSTATTVTLARLARAHPGSQSLLAAGILSAGVVMLVRVAVVVMAINPALLPSLLWPLCLGGAVMLAGAGVALLLRGDAEERATLDIANPLELMPALKMAALIVVVMLTARLLQHHFGDAGLFATAGISGLADVDAIVISIAQMAVDVLDARVATLAILLAVAANTLVKALLAGFAGGVRLGLHIGVINAAATAAGAAGALWR